MLCVRCQKTWCISGYSLCVVCLYEELIDGFALRPFPSVGGNPCGEIVLAPPELCNVGYTCTSCDTYIVGSEDGICGRCLQNAQIVASRQIGCLMDGNFYCTDCGSWWEKVADQSPVFLTNIGQYSQVCTCCRKVIVAGSFPFNLFPCKYEDSRKVLQ